MRRGSHSFARRMNHRTNTVQNDIFTLDKSIPVLLYDKPSEIAATETSVCTVKKVPCLISSWQLAYHHFVLSFFFLLNVGILAAQIAVYLNCAGTESNFDYDLFPGFLCRLIVGGRLLSLSVRV